MTGDGRRARGLQLDIIGDIHGQLDALLSLGMELDYDVDAGWSHRDGRRLVFIGDLVDRGSHGLEVAQLVRDLCREGRALCLMGNHEFNLVEKRYRRTEAKSSNSATIADIEARPEAWAPVLDFFESLPLAIELDDLRVTHAVWNRGCVAELDPALRECSPSHPVAPEWVPLIRLHTPYDGGRLRPDIPQRKFRDETCGQQFERSLEILLKGHEMDAPEPFRDNDGEWRDKVRAEWWLDGHPEVPREHRLVFGHYWNMPPIRGRHEAFVPPHPSGHPKLRAWFDEHHTAVEPRGQVAVPDHVKAVCIDYNGVNRARGGRPCVGAYRYPEAEVVWSTSG